MEQQIIERIDGVVTQAIKTVWQKHCDKLIEEYTPIVGADAVREIIEKNSAKFFADMDRLN